MPRDKAAEEAEKKKHQKIADGIEKATQGFVKEAIPQIKGFLDLTDQESKMLAGAVGAVATVAIGYFSGNWVDAAFKIAGFIMSMFGSTQDPTAAALARIEADVLDMRKLLAQHFDAQAADELQSRAGKVNSRLRDCIAKFPPGQADDVAWLSTFDYQQLDAYATDAFGVVDELLGIAGGPSFVPALWNRTYQKTDLVGMPFWRKEDDGNHGQLFFTQKDPDAKKSPLDSSGDRFDYRMPLSILAAVLPQVIAIMRLRDPFFQTTGRFSERLTSWADALDGKIAESIEACILRSDHIRLFRIFNKFAGTDDWFVDPIPAGAVNFVTGESVFVGWAPGVSVKWTDIKKRKFETHDYNVMSWPWPGKAPLHSKDLPPLEAFASAGYGPFVDHCVQMMRQTLPLPQVRNLAASLRALATTPPSSETFGREVSAGLATREIEQMDSETGSVTYRGISYDVRRRFVTTESVLARPYRQRVGDGIYFHFPGTRPRRSGAIIQWPLHSIFSNEAYPIAYRVSLQDSDGVRHVLYAESIDDGAVRGAYETARTYNGAFDVPCETFDFITGSKAPPVAVRWGDQSPDAIAVGGKPAAGAPVAAVPQTELLLRDRIPVGLLANVRPGNISGRWAITVNGGMLGLAILWDGLKNASELSLVIEESRAYRPGGPAGPAPVTVLPILVTQDQLVVDDPAYWTAIEKAQNEYLGLINQIWFVIDQPFDRGVIFPERPEDVPLELTTVDGILHRIHGGLENRDLRETLHEAPQFRRMLER